MSRQGAHFRGGDIGSGSILSVREEEREDADYARTENEFPWNTFEDDSDDECEDKSGHQE